MTLSNDKFSNPLAPDTPDTILRDHWLIIARATWVALAALSLVLVVSGILALFAQQFSFGALVEGDPRHLGDLEARALSQLGLTIDSFRMLYVGMDIVFLIAYCFIPIVIMRRRSNDWMAIAVSSALILYGATLTLSFQTLLQAPATANFPARFLNALSTISVPILVYLFPDGRFIPRWTRWLAGFWAIWGLASLFISAIDPMTWSPLFLYLLMLVGLATSLYAQVYRYRRVSTLEQRQQTKWVVFGFAFATLGYTVMPILSLIFPSLLAAGATRVIYGICFTIAIYLFQLAVPISFGFSILRYRLWDIDLIINRSIVYFIVTVSALTIFEIGNEMFRQFFEKTVGSESPMGFFVPGVVVAIAIKPLHDRTQEFIDKSFYREKLATSEAFVDFAREARNVMSVPHLLGLLVERVSDALHLMRSAVYVRDSDGHFQLAEALNVSQSETADWLNEENILDRLERGLAVSRPDNKIFPLLLPLTLPKLARRTNPNLSLLAGILAIGPRFSGQGYSKEDRSLLLTLADDVGTAMYMARLASENDGTQINADGRG